jgi:segregation and condensation protein B
MDMGWVGLGTRRTTPGRPITFLVTKDFLDHFGLESTKDLPGINELRETGLLNRSSTTIEETKVED